MIKKWIELNGPFISLLLLTVMVFYAGVTASFSSDDYIHLLNNTTFNNFNEALVVFTEPFGREYRPLVRISLWLNHLMGDTAIPFKITNLLLHLITTFFVYSILGNLGFSRLSTLLGTAIFALHPIHVTSIHFILGRTDLVAAVFYFGTLALVAGWKNTVSIKQYLVVSLPFIAALLSKEMSVTLCLTMFAVVFYGQSVKNTQSFMRVFLKLSPFFVMTFVYTIIRMLMWSKLANDVAGYTNYSLQHLIENYANWLFALVYPFDLYVAQDFMVEKPVGFFSIALGFVLALLGLLFVLYGRILFTIHKSFWLWAALTWICVTLLPICGGNPHRWYLYIPSFGLCLLGAAAIDASDKNKKKYVAVLVGFLLVIYSIEDLRLSSIWKRQADVTANILNQIKTGDIYKKERIYVANIPFGFGSAYLFTLSSLQEAMEYTFGKSPNVIAVSYLNMDDDISINSSIDGKTIYFKMEPNYYNFFLLSATERRFSNLEVKSRENVLVKINVIAKNKKISDYSVTIPNEIRSDFYYFDGKKIKSAYDIGP